MPNILIVDDSSFMRTILSRMLQEDGFLTHEARNGMEAIQIYTQIQPDIVTMDITMPVMGGIKAVKAIRTLHPKAKILMVTALGQESLLSEAIQSGAMGFVIKPFQLSKVLHEVRLILQINR